MKIKCNLFNFNNLPKDKRKRPHPMMRKYNIKAKNYLEAILKTLSKHSPHSFNDLSKAFVNVNYSYDRLKTTMIISSMFCYNLVELSSIKKRK